MVRRASLARSAGRVALDRAFALHLRRGFGPRPIFSAGLENRWEGKPAGGIGLRGGAGDGRTGGVKKALLAIAIQVAVSVAILWGLDRHFGRDAPPSDESEFAVERPDVAPEDNAFTYFLQATNFLSYPEDGKYILSYFAGDPARAQDIEQLLEDHQECFSLIEEGTKRSICLAPPLKGYEDIATCPQPWLKMGRLLGLRNRSAWLAGKYSKAVSHLQTTLRFGDLVQKDAECLVVYLVGSAICSMAFEQAIDLAQDERVSDRDLKRLAGLLAGVGPFDRGLERAVRREYRFGASIIDDIRKHRENAGIFQMEGADIGKRRIWLLVRSNYLFQPNRTKEHLAERIRSILRLVPKTYGDMGMADVPWVRREMKALESNRIGWMIMNIAQLKVSPILEAKCKAEGGLAGARLVVACNRFEREFGRWPLKLQELVPGYLAEVPRDPYDGNPFRYSAEKERVWAVGTNLTDEGGSMQIKGLNKGYIAGRDRPRTEDFVFELQDSPPAEQ